MHTTTTGDRKVLNTNLLETRGFRPEIQGLRALALFLVVTYHIWFGKVSGGVDVFLFISAFLLSLSSVRKVNEGRPLAPVKYWLHVFQRLLPAAATVVAATVLASFIFLAPSRLLSIVHDAFATLFYWLNWRLAFNSVDYYAQDAAGKTPLQHFWSLSLQGQIFILWPLLFVLVAYLTRRLRLRLIAATVVIFGAIFVVSLAFSIHETANNQGFAYFDTRTRLWEFAAGTLLAILTFIWRPPYWARIPMGWIGIIGLISCGFLLPVEQSFPGYLALWPLLFAALVIMAGQTDSKLGADRVLSSKPMLKLGEISYALYLVHWPVFIIYSTKTQQNHPGFVEGTVLILVCMVLAWGIHRYIEQPLRKDTQTKTHRVDSQNSDKKILWIHKVKKHDFVKPFAVISGCLLLAVLPLLLAKKVLQEREAEMVALASQAGSDKFPGAFALGTEKAFKRYSYPPIPATDPDSQYDNLEKGNCAEETELWNSELSFTCGSIRYGESEALNVMAVGDSHVGQAISFLRPLAEQHQMTLTDLSLGGCSFPAEAEYGFFDECITYHEYILDEIYSQHPDYIALMVTRTLPGSGEEHLVEGIEQQVQQLTDSGIRVIAIRDNPRWEKNVYECAQENSDNQTTCGAQREERLAPENPAAELISSSPLVYGLDFSDQFCPDNFCSAVIGNIYVYLDDNHVSKAYGSTLIDSANRQLEEQGWLEQMQNPHHMQEMAEEYQ